MTAPSVTVIGCVQVDLLVSPVENLRSPGASMFLDHMDLRAGGAGANVALAFAETPMNVRLIGCVGDDRLGDWMVEQLGEAGLDSEIVRVPGQATGLTVACEAPDRDRAFLTYLGVNAVWDLSMISADAYLVENLLFCDYFCAPGLRGAAARELLSRARETGPTTFLDTGWDPNGFGASTREELHSLLEFVDVFLPNEAEARAIAGVAGPVEKAARLLRSISGGWVVVKLGPRGCFACGPDGFELAVPAPVVELSDSTGAGDAFNAGLVAALSAGRGWPDALHEATSFASSILARPSGSRYLAAQSRTD